MCCYIFWESLPSVYLQKRVKVSHSTSLIIFTCMPVLSSSRLQLVYFLVFLACGSLFNIKVCVGLKTQTVQAVSETKFAIRIWWLNPLYTFELIYLDCTIVFNLWCFFLWAIRLWKLTHSGSISGAKNEPSAVMSFLQCCTSIRNQNCRKPTDVP